MSVEARRGCGFRKIGGIYLVGGGIGIPCDRLPFELGICSCCGQGIKQARGFTWIDTGKFFQGQHLVDIVSRETDIKNGRPCPCGGTTGHCQLCYYPELMGKAGLLWIGEKFYKSPDDFLREGFHLGFSRRLSMIPRNFKIGETWVFLAHPKAIATAKVGTLEVEYTPGIFYAWMPTRIEKVLPESERGNIEELDRLEKRGIVPVFVPDADKDHQGNVHDDYEREQKGREK